MIMSWGRALAAHTIPGSDLGTALTRLASKPFPPDLGALISEALGRVGGDAEVSLRRAARAAAEFPPAYYRLTSVEIWAAREFGGVELRETRLSAGDVKRWGALLEEAVGRNDLPDVPKKPVAQIGEKFKHNHEKAAALAEFWNRLPKKRRDNITIAGSAKRC